MFSTTLGLKNHFFSNKSLLSLSLKNIRQPKIASFKSNVQLLQSNFIPIRGYIKETIYQSTRDSPFKRSNTWKNYNQFYNRSNWDKLKKPFLFTVAFCVVTTLVTPYVYDYTPFAYFKRHPQHLLWSIIGINAAVFFMWRIPRLQWFTMKYGILFKDNIQSSWSLLGSAFSHQSFAHFFINMLAFQSFGSTLVTYLGVANFTAMYLNAAVISSFASLAIPMFLGSSLSVASLGASGAIFSVFGTFAYLFPAAPVGLFFIPVPGGAWVLFLGTALWNAAGTVLRWGTFDYAAHLGGSIIGVAYGYWYTRKRKEQLRRRRVWS
ncbi:PCP1 Rhomboid protein 1 [Candida maltosa Xu316]